jgi:hypothetical protein
MWDALVRRFCDCLYITFSQMTLLKRSRIENNLVPKYKVFRIYMRAIENLFVEHELEAFDVMIQIFTEHHVLLQSRR